MRRSERAKMDGDEYDFLADRGTWRRLICHGRDHLRYVKNRWNRKLRRRSKEELRREAEYQERERENV